MNWHRMDSKNNVKWFSIPELPVASAFSFYAANCASQPDSAICADAIVFAQRAARLKECAWTAGWIGIALAFTPFVPAIKILPLGLTCLAACITLIEAFRMQPAPID